LQLPPVPDRGQPIKFCFEAASFRRCVPLCIELRRVFRQHESTFVRMLAELRMGIVSDEALTELRARVRRPLNNLPDGMEPTSMILFE
jgi:ATP-dependent DNA helicase PIF1